MIQETIVEPNNPSQLPQTKLEEITLNAQQYLSNFAQGDNFDSVLETAFATPQAPLLAHSLRTGEFLDRLDLEIRSADQLEGALGAYASFKDTIFLSRSLLTQGTVEQATDVLLEEVGHAIDDFVNDTDTPGDEGDIFASLVQGNELRDRDLASLRQEDDRATLEIGGEQVVVEQAEFTVTNTDDSGEGSLRSAIAQANGSEGEDTITFNSNLSGETIGLTSGQLEITESLTIEGLGAEELTVDAGGNSRIFRIDDSNDFNENSEISVTIDGLTIQGGSADSGGGIFNKEDLTLTNSTISSNSGGGLYHTLGTVNINNSTISGNSATSGGGIDNNDSGSSSTVNISNSTISGNSAFRGGGVYNTAGTTLNLKNSTLRGNSAFDGGAINHTGIANITNSTISGNIADANGGGIDNSGGTANITNSTINGNISGGGGAIDNEGTANIINSTLSNNSADSSGGGISGGTVNITNSTFSGNAASNNGGAINNAGVNMANGTISGNVASDNGGGIHSNSTVNVTNSTISGNAASNGGGIYNYSTGAELILANSIISGNEASNSGNEIYNDNNSTINADANNLFGDGSQTNNEAFQDFSPGSNNINATSDGTNTPLGNILELDSDGNPLLQDNGGPTKTIELVANSPAIDAGDDNKIPTDEADLDGDNLLTENIPFDQRGEGFDRVVNGTVDLGAVEVQQEPIEIPTNIADFEAAEGDSGETTFTFTVTLDQAPSQQVTVDFATSDGTATAGEDYEAASGTLTFEQGETEQTIEVTVLGDTNNESNETFNIELSNPTGNLTLEDGTATGTIENDDGDSPTSVTVQTLGQSDNNINIGGNAESNTEIIDFGGNDTYTILPELAGPVVLADEQSSTINLPDNLTVTGARFLSNGAEFDINGNTITLLGELEQFSFVFGGTPLDPSAGTELNFQQTAQAFGTTVPPADQDTPNQAPNSGTINPDGTVSSNVATNLTGETEVKAMAEATEPSVLEFGTDNVAGVPKASAIEQITLSPGISSTLVPDANSQNRPSNLDLPELETGAGV